MRSTLPEDTERAQFLMKLASRIRRLESDTIISLTKRMEQALHDFRLIREGSTGEGTNDIPPEEDLLLILGHCMRGLALLGRGKEAENIFARVAIM